MSNTIAYLLSIIASLLDLLLLLASILYFNSIINVDIKLGFDRGNPSSKQKSHFCCRYRCGTTSQRVDLDTVLIELARSVNINFVEEM